MELIMSKIASLYSHSYGEARTKFLAACDSANIRVRDYCNEHVLGVEGEKLYTDVAWFGDDDAASVLFLTSGVHGIEGYCGSAVLTGLVEDGVFANLPGGKAVVLVHAINPYGFSHKRRVNEDNVDINRNFVEFPVSGTAKTAYADVHSFLVPEQWYGPAKDAADASLAAFVEANGAEGLRAVVSHGQHVYPDGMFYAGKGPAWSNVTWRSIIREFASSAREILHLDIHTGLGPFGEGELISGMPRACRGTQTAEKLFAGRPITFPGAEDSVSTAISGFMSGALFEEVQASEIVSLTIEFGTLPEERVVAAIRADNWLYLKCRNYFSPYREAIKSDICAAFYPDDLSWKQAVWDDSVEIVMKLYDHLKGA